MVHPDAGEVFEVAIDPESFTEWRLSGRRGWNLRTRAARHGFSVADLVGTADEADLSKACEQPRVVV